MRKYNYDLIVIGGGPVGLVASKFALGIGKKVAIVEKNKLGGECTLTGCVPSKALIKAAEAAHTTKHLNKYGISSKQDISLDTAHVMNHVRSIVDQIYQTHTPKILETSGIDVIIGPARFKNNHEIMIDDKTISGNKIIIGTGSQPFIPPIEGIDTVAFLTNETLFDLETIPTSMIILGGGPIGLEMASAFNRLGCSVTLIEMNENILPREEHELSHILCETLIHEGVKILTSTKAVKVSSQSGVTISCIDSGNKPFDITGEKLLVATGRKPNTESLDLEKAEVRFNKRGIIVNNKLQTSQKNIYACGDVVGPYNFSHMAEYQAVAAARNALVPFFKKHINYDNVCWVTFTDPELASAGLTEKQAREKYGDSIRVYKKTYDSIDRARTDMQTIGLGKFICDKKGRILGAHILGPRAGELIHEIQLGKYYKIKFTDFYSVIHAYPTYSDIVWHAAKKAYVDRVKNNFFVRLVSRFLRKKTGK